MEKVGCGGGGGGGGPKTADHYNFSPLISNQ